MGWATRHPETTTNVRLERLSSALRAPKRLTAATSRNRLANFGRESLPGHRSSLLRARAARVSTRRRDSNPRPSGYENAEGQCQSGSIERFVRGHVTSCRSRLARLEGKASELDVGRRLAEVGDLAAAPDCAPLTSGTSSGAANLRAASQIGEGPERGDHADGEDREDREGESPAKRAGTGGRATPLGSGERVRRRAVRQRSPG